MGNHSTFAKEEGQQRKKFLSSQVPKRQPRLTGSKPWAVLLLILLVLGLVYVGMYPWAFFMGGNLHPLGHWSGWGQLHSKSQGNYFLHVTLSPVTYGHETFPAWDVKGTGNLCTPKGERFRLRVAGDMPRKFYIHSVGQPIRLWAPNWRATLPVGAEKRPSFDLWGRWGEREIFADDRKTLSKTFSDGTLDAINSRTVASDIENIQITLHEGSYLDWEAACPKTP